MIHIIIFGSITTYTYAEEPNLQSGATLPTIIVVAEDEQTSYTKKQASTSTKLDLDIKQTPQSVTVISRKQIEDMGFTNLGQALLNTTGVILTGDNTERTNFSIRGFSQGGAGGFNSPLQYDGVTANVSYLSASKPDMAMIESIEVVRGAAGLMQGTGNPSGAINLIRKKPTTEFQASGALSYGSWNTVRGEVDVSNPLNQDGSIRGRLVLAYQDADSYMDAVTRDSNLVYGIVSADLTDRTLLNLSYARQGEHAVVVNSLPRYADGSDAQFGRKNCGCSADDFWDKANAQGFLDVTHTFDSGWQIKGSYLKANMNMDMVFTSLAWADSGAIDPNNPLAAINKYAYRYDQDIDVLDVFAKGKFQLFGREHELVIGANAEKNLTLGEWSSYDQVLENHTLWNQGTDSDKKFPLKQVNPFTWNPYSLLGIQARYDKGNHDNLDIRQKGAYLTSRWNIIDPLNMIVGARTSTYEYTRKAWSNVTGQMTSDVTYKKSDVLTPYVGLTFDLNDTYTTYASFTDTFVVQNVKDRNEKLLDPIQGNVYEIGIKGGFNDDRFIVSLAAFRTNQINRALRDESSKGQCQFNGGEGYCNIASGEVISEGIETELRGEIIPNLNTSFGYTYNTTEYKKDLANQGRVFSETTPEHIVRVFASYKLPNNLTIGGGVNYQSEWLVGRYGTRPAKQPAYALVNLMASYPINKNLSVALNANNVFNEKYYSYITSSSNRYGEPRNYTLTLRAKF